MMQPDFEKRLAMLTFSRRQLAQAARVSERTLASVLGRSKYKHKRRPHPSVMQAIDLALKQRILQVRDEAIAMYGLPQGE